MNFQFVKLLTGGNVTLHPADALRLCDCSEFVPASIRNGNVTLHPAVALQPCDKSELITASIRNAGALLGTVDNIKFITKSKSFL